MLGKMFGFLWNTEINLGTTTEIREKTTIQKESSCTQRKNRVPLSTDWGVRYLDGKSRRASWKRRHEEVLRAYRTWI